MRYFKQTILSIVVSFMVPGLALASNSVLSGVFDGTETKIAPLAGSCGGTRPLGYKNLGAFQVSASGIYTIVDAFNLNGVDVTALIYEAPFDENNPEANLMTPSGIDVVVDIELIGGASYYLVVQQWCQNQEGAWALGVSGPGNVTSDNVVMTPTMTEGAFSNDQPTASTDCGDSQYVESGPVVLSQTGLYFYTDIGIESDVDACLQVYTAPFDPNNPEANRVGGYLDDFDSIELQAGQDYYFVVQPFGSTVNGEYFYILAPPAPFRINNALAANWYNPATSGQGFQFAVYESINFLFAAWYTFELERPDPGVTATIGEPGQRWLTGQGVYSGNTAAVKIYNSQGGVFDSGTPKPEHPEDGTLTVEFTSCTEGTVDYVIDSASVSGTIPIQPAVPPSVDPDSLEMCERLTEVPGMPGLL